MTLLLTPSPRLEAFALGVASPGALLYTWAAGQIGVLPQPTFTDAAGLVPNTNPVIADASGLFGPFYLSTNITYDVQLFTALGVLVWSQPNVLTGGTGSPASSDPDFVQLEAFL